MYSFDYVWPYMGLGAALLLALLLATGALRSDKTVSRWRDIVWLTWLGMLAYLVHQFEEHGVDINGTGYAFRESLCRFFEFVDPKTCPLPPSVITAVNVPAVWLLGPAAALLGRRWPLVALSFFSIPSLNFIAHVASAVEQGAYNPGTLTAIVLFLPLSLWAFYVAIVDCRLGWRGRRDRRRRHRPARHPDGIVVCLSRGPHRRCRPGRNPGDQSCLRTLDRAAVRPAR